MSEALLKMALRCQEEPDAIPVLGDMLIEAGRDHGALRTWVMALLIGVPLDTALPAHIESRGETARQTWRQRRRESLAMPERHWPVYAASCSAAWARAVLAVLLFGAWRPATTTTPGPWNERTRSPWAVVRARPTRLARETLDTSSKSRGAWHRLVSSLKGYLGR